MGTPRAEPRSPATRSQLRHQGRARVTYRWIKPHNGTGSAPRLPAPHLPAHRGFCLRHPGCTGGTSAAYLHPRTCTTGPLLASALPPPDLDGGDEFLGFPVPQFPHLWEQAAQFAGRLHTLKPNSCAQDLHPRTSSGSGTCPCSGGGGR